MLAARELGEHDTLVRALILMDHAEHQLGVPGLGARHREALQICIDHGFRQRESTVRLNLGAFAYYAGRWTEAAEWYRTGRQVALEAGSAFVAAQTDVNLAELLINQGRVDEAEEILVDANRVLRASGAVRFLAEGQMQLARVHLSRGDLEDAERRAAEVASMFSALGNPSSALEAALVQAEAVLSAGRAQEALGIIDVAEHEARSEAAFSMPRTCLQRGRALLDLDRIEEADEMITSGLLAARAQDLPYEESLLLQVSSRLERLRGHDDRARAARIQSEELLARLGVRA
jgi:tetratricopeptide (TPR) repeat protein